MNRRKFFNMLGSAVIGTVIALKIPENIAPIKLDIPRLKGIEEIYRLIDTDLKMAMEAMTRSIWTFGRPLTADEIIEAWENNLSYDDMIDRMKKKYTPHLLNV